MKKKLKKSDRHLGPPSEANRDKHINFVALESGDPDPANQTNSRKRSPDNSKENKEKSDSGNRNKRK